MCQRRRALLGLWLRAAAQSWAVLVPVPVGAGGALGAAGQKVCAARTQGWIGLDRIRKSLKLGLSTSFQGSFSATKI